MISQVIIIQPDTNFFTSFLQVLLDLAILVKVLKEYRKFKYNNLKYLIGALVLFVIVDIQALSITGQSSDLVVELNLIIDVILNSLIIFYCLNLFLDSFHHETPFTKTNLIFGGIIIALWCSSYIIWLNIAGIFQITNYDFSNIQAIIDYLPTNDPLWVPFQIIFILILLGGVFLVVSVISFYIKLTKPLKRTTNRQKIQIIKRMRLSFFLILVGYFFPENFSWLTHLISIFGYFLLFYFYLSKNIFVFQEEDLKRLIIINSSGLPVYVYKFRNYKDNDTGIERDEDLLFSGAYNAVSSLISELLGQKQNLKEIVLDNFVLLSKVNKSVIFLLLSKKHTQFYMNALNTYVEGFYNVIRKIPENEMLINDSKKNLDTYTEKMFGFIQN